MNGGLVYSLDAESPMGFNTIHNYLHNQVWILAKIRLNRAGIGNCAVIIDKRWSPPRQAATSDLTFAATDRCTIKFVELDGPLLLKCCPENKALFQQMMCDYSRDTIFFRRYFSQNLAGSSSHYRVLEGTGIQEHYRNYDIHNEYMNTGYPKCRDHSFRFFSKSIMVSPVFVRFRDKKNTKFFEPVFWGKVLKLEYADQLSESLGFKQ